MLSLDRGDISNSREILVEKLPTDDDVISSSSAAEVTSHPAKSRDDECAANATEPDVDERRNEGESYSARSSDAYGKTNYSFEPPSAFDEPV